MIKTRIALLLLSACYLATSMVVLSQSLDRRITIIEQQLQNHVDYVAAPAIERLEYLEQQVNRRDLLIEGRLVALERSIANFGQLLLAVGGAVLIQLLSALIGGLRAARSRSG